MFCSKWVMHEHVIETVKNDNCKMHTKCYVKWHSDELFVTSRSHCHWIFLITVPLYCLQIAIFCSTIQCWQNRSQILSGPFFVFFENTPTWQIRTKHNACNADRHAAITMPFVLFMTTIYLMPRTYSKFQIVKNKIIKFKIVKDTIYSEL